MAHIHTDDGQYDFTVSAFIVRYFNNEPKVLLHMHRKLHKLLPVGGHIELNETPWEGLRHELREESGYMLEKLQVLQPQEQIPASEYEYVVVQPTPIHVNSHETEHVKRHFHTDFGYALVATDDPDDMPDVGESLDLLWLTREEIVAIPDDIIWPNTRTNALSVLDVYLDKWNKVPATDFLREA
jgi:ADP-ribose pyrophosphatase YjhB (NUDIX family)